MKPHRLYRFDAFCLDATAKVLLRAGQPVALTRKAVETLLVLAENGGQVVLKEDLLETIWPGRVVEEANLTQNIAMVRKALGAARGTPAYIETFPRRGYRLVGPVTDELAADNENISTAQPMAEPTEPITKPARNSANVLTYTSPLSAAGSLLLEPAQSNPPLAANAARKIGERLSGWRSAALLFLLGAVLAGGWFFWSRRPKETEAVLRVTPLTRLAGRETQPALSPDGKRLAFLWEQDDGQPPELRVQTEAATTSLRIGAQQSHYSSPTWSPDGRALAFLRIGKAATEVLTVALHGDGVTSLERLVTQFAPPNYGFKYRMLDWSPDGQWLAVSHSATPDKPNGLFLVNLATGEKKALTNPEGLVGGDLDPRFAPDGRRLSFIRHIHRSHHELYMLALDGGAPQPLTSDAKQISGHAWLNDGGRIVFASDRSGEFRLWKLAAGGEPQRLEIFSAFPLALSVARQTPLLAYAAEQQVRSVWRLDLQTKNWARVIASSAQDASPQYSPDGRQICFRSDRTGAEQLWVSDAAGAQQSQITQGALYPSVGHWSPDGRQIAFNNARSGELFIASQQENGGWTVRPLNQQGVHPVFAPDGQWLYAGGAKSIVKIPVGGGGPAVEVVKTGGFSLGLAQDGKLLFFKREPNDAVLWQARTDTGEVSRALDGLLPSCTSCWALTPTGIYYLGSDKTSFDAQAIYFHRFGATEPDRLIVKYPEPLAPVGSGPFSLSPDLRYLLCVRMNPAHSDIMRVEPFR